MSKSYFADTVFLHGKNLPESVCNALNELHFTLVAGIDTHASFHADTDTTTSVFFDIDMGQVSADLLKNRVMDALRTLFRIKAENWTKVKGTEEEGCYYRTRTIMCPEQSLAIHISLRY